jgi:hypothetical protein
MTVLQQMEAFRRGVPCRKSRRMDIRLSVTVDNFVDAKASNFNNVQQTSTSKPQLLQ